MHYQSNQTIMIPANLQKYLPTVCPSCGSILTFDGIHLMCNNKYCGGIVAKKLAYAVGVLDLKGVGNSTIAPFAKDFSNMYRLFQWILLNNQDPKFNLERYGITKGSRSEEIFVKSFTNIKSLKYSQVILLMGFDGVGNKLSEQVARQYCGLKYDYASLEKALVDSFQNQDIYNYIQDSVKFLEAHGVSIDRPVDKTDANTIHVCMTGSPKDFGFKTKEEFLKQFPNCQETDLKHAKYLITDSYTSNSGKMAAARKAKVTIVTYGDFKA